MTKRTMSHGTVIAALALGLAAGPVFAQVAEVPADAIGLKVTQGIKVVYHIKTKEMNGDMSAGVHELLHLMEIYESLGLGRDEYEIHVVFDGPAVQFVLKDFDQEGEGNPNAEALATLAKKGVHLEACGQNLRFHGHAEKELLPGVKVALGGQPRVIDLQLQGFAYFRY
jgi:intracellular sulfur oxidation DsrE/DsrF family protein